MSDAEYYDDADDGAPESAPATRSGESDFVTALRTTARTALQSKAAQSLLTPFAGAAVAAVASAAVLFLVFRRGGSKRRRGKRATTNNRKSVSAAARGTAEEATAGANGETNSKAAVKPSKAIPSAKPKAPGKFAKLKPTADCVALADGSACVVRRKVAGDNNCMFNAVGYAMHHSHGRARTLRQLIAQEVAGNPSKYNAVFLDMPNEHYCQRIMSPQMGQQSWGGAIELSILQEYYETEIATWNIRTAAVITFGEVEGHTKQMMLIYDDSRGSGAAHYDALAVAEGPNADPAEDITVFNPRTKRGKMIRAAAEKLTELNHIAAGYSKLVVLCGDCGKKLRSQQEIQAHALSTGHQHYTQA